MTESELNRIFQQIGELVGSLRALHEKIDYRYALAEKQSDCLKAEMQALRGDLRELEGKHDSAIHILTEDITVLRQAQDGLDASVAALRAPIQEIISLREKIMGACLVLGPLGAVILWLVPELWRSAWHLVEVWLGDTR